MTRVRRPEVAAPPPGRRVHGLVRLGLWVAALLVVSWLFHALGDGPLAAPPPDPEGLRAWAADRDGLVAAVALLRLVVLGLAWYLVGVTAAGIAARLLRSARLVAVADAFTLPVIRRLLQTTLGVSLAASMAVVPVSIAGSRFAGAERVVLAAADGTDASGEGPEGPAIIRLAPAGDGPSELRLAPGEPAGGPEAGPGASATTDEVPAPAGRRAAGGGAVPGDTNRPFEPGEVGVARVDGAGSGPPLPRATPEGEPGGDRGPTLGRDVVSAAGTAPDAPARIHVVRAGDSLWTIARDELAERLGQASDDARIAAYWHRVIEHNRSALDDPDNPDLIFPGQRFELPDVAPPSLRGTGR
jgi:nucleoid-associated protein YgaU